MSFSEIFPQLQGWVDHLKYIWPGSVIADSQWLYTVFGITHLLTLGLLGGAVVLLNMRMLGVGMTSVSPAVMERQLRPYLWIGVGGILFTGIIIGWANADKLYVSSAFLVKMVSLTGALIFSFGVAAQAARAETDLSTGGKILALVAFALWLLAMVIFTNKGGTNPGAVHLVFAGFAILLGFARPTTRMIAIGIAAIDLLVYVVVGYLVLKGPDLNYEAMMGVTGDDGGLAKWGLTQWCVNAAAVAVVGLTGYEIFTNNTTDAKGPGVRLTALFSILCWVTVAAAGRWIGLSP